MAALTCLKNSRSRILTRPTRCVQRSKPIKKNKKKKIKKKKWKKQTAVVLGANSSVAVCERWYIQQILEEIIQETKLEIFVLDSDTRNVLDQAFLLLSDPWLLQYFGVLYNYYLHEYICSTYVSYAAVHFCYLNRWFYSKYLDNRGWLLDILVDSDSFQF